MDIWAGQKYRKVKGHNLANGTLVGKDYVVSNNGSGIITFEGMRGLYTESFIKENFILIEDAEDRTNWHPHHDVIVAWAKGANVQGTSPCGKTKVVYASGELSTPSFRQDWNWEIIEEPDHTAEIAEIERKMRELSESQEELADRLEKLK